MYVMYFFVDEMENPFKSPAPRGVKNQECGDSTKNHPDGVSGCVPALRRTQTMLFQAPNSGQVIQTLSGEKPGLPLPISPRFYVMA